MNTFAEYLVKIDAPEQKERMEELFSWINETFPTLEPVIKWNQPMYTNHGTFIIGFSMAKKHMAVSPEHAGMVRFDDRIREAGYDRSKELIRIRWDQPVDYSLLKEMIEFNIKDKADCSTFWRK